MPPPPCPLCHTLEQARRADQPRHIASLSVSQLLLGEDQGCPGWCVVVLNEHQEHLELLPPSARSPFLDDVQRAADAIRRAFPEAARLNYACLCNQVPHLHWHLIPRRPTDPPGAVWSWPEDRQRGATTEDERRALRDAIRRAMR